MDALHWAQLAVVASGAAVVSAVATIIHMWLKRNGKSEDRRTGSSNKTADTSRHEVTVLVDGQDPVTVTNVRGAEVQRLKEYILGEDPSGDIGSVTSK